ncbi:chaperone NapD [Vibrio marisflavi]|uniref:Chaperone NapD n=1 Tax=Vibrio marisflavi CECT 7928 TaxID=634439 RepID=A0ABN8E313_9VIBR|nr:chaperone NapD [Vibrio marisflavi]CAH0536885.1 Chaperone NapD [Vibrio marisflavi CECT 7928]
MAPKNEVHISSLVVYSAANEVSQTIKQIEQLDGAEVYGHSEEGKIVVVLETTNEGFVTDLIDTINQIPSVINAVLVYHQIEHEHENNNFDGTNYSQAKGEA